MTIIGYNVLNYKSKTTGKPVTGTKVFCSSEFSPTSSGVGYSCTDFYVKPSVWDDFLNSCDDIGVSPLGCDISCLYNQYGNVEQIRLIVNP